MSPRPYRLGKREAVVEATRDRVIEAARAVFSEAGFYAATLDDVAQRATVARATVYYQFESKLGLLDAVFARVTQADAERLRAAAEHHDAAAALRGYVREICRCWEAERRLFVNMMGIVGLDSGAAVVVDRYEAHRREQLVWLTKRLDDQRKLRAGLSQRQAVDALWALTAFGSFNHLVSRSNLSARDASKMLEGLASSVLESAMPVEAPALPA